MITANFRLSGFVDIYLIDKMTGNVDLHVREPNQITEPFARWLLLGNLSPRNAVSIEQRDGSGNKSLRSNEQSNAISRFLGSGSLLVDSPSYRLTDNIRQGYQIVRHGSGTAPSGRERRFMAL